MTVETDLPSFDLPLADALPPITDEAKAKVKAWAEGVSNQASEAAVALLAGILVELRNQRGPASDSRSSVEIKVTSNRGPDVAVKVYQGSPVDGLRDDAMLEFGLTQLGIDEAIKDGWKATVAALLAKRAAAEKPEPSEALA